MPKKKKTDYTVPVKCGHCKNFGPMIRLFGYSQVELHEDEGMSSEHGYVYTLLECTSCHELSLQRYFWYDSMEGETSEELLYPAPSRPFAGLPDEIRRAYEAASKVRSIDHNAYAVLIGRLLDLVCVDRKAEGNTLAKKLADLAHKGEIPTNLVGVSSGIRQFRNIGAHADLGSLTALESSLLDSLCRAILEYVYTAPYLAARAQIRFDKLTKPGAPLPLGD